MWLVGYLTQVNGDCCNALGTARCEDIRDFPTNMATSDILEWRLSKNNRTISDKIMKICNKLTKSFLCERCLKKRYKLQQQI